MPAKSYKTIVVLPDDTRLEASYYCKDSGSDLKEKQTRLFIQLHDCICTLKIEKTICNNPGELEKIVQKKVINARGHLC